MLASWSAYTLVMRRPAVRSSGVSLSSRKLRTSSRKAVSAADHCRSMGSPVRFGRHIVNLVTQLAVIAVIAGLVPRTILDRRGGMNRDELFTSIVAARPGRDDIVYLRASRGRIRLADGAGWRPRRRQIAVGDPRTSGCRFQPTWPVDDPERLRAFFDDMMAELESMADKTGSVSLADRRTLAALPLTGGHRGLSDQPGGPSKVQALQAAVGFRIAAPARSRTRGIT